MKPLSPRQQSILNRVVDTHIETALPVGSRSITSLYQELYRQSYSPATVRYEMVRLEDMGYLTHPHTSAGRVPTDQGYRYYVNHSLPAEEFPGQILRQMSEDLQKASEEMDSFAEKATVALSNLSEEVSLIIVADPSDGSRRLRVFLQGSSRLLEKPEFQDLEKIKNLFKAFEEKPRLGEWLRAGTPDTGVGVTIGQENESAAFHHCSVVATHYSVCGQNRGTIAVIGPRRMKYSRTVPLVARMAQVMGGILEQAGHE